MSAGTWKVPVEMAVASGHRHFAGQSNTIMCGGALAALEHDKMFPGKFTYAYGDVDFFHSSMEALMTNIAHFLSMGGVPLDAEEERRIAGWKEWGSEFHTNSVRMQSLDGVEMNLVYKEQNRHPLRTVIEVTNSFDFSNVTHAIEMHTGLSYDLFNYYWPGEDSTEIRLLPDRERQWKAARVSKYTGERQAGRYAKNAARGYNMQLAKLPLVQGYMLTGEHYLRQDDEEKQLYGGAYLDLAGLIQADSIDEILHCYKSSTPNRMDQLAAALRSVSP